MSLDEMKLRTRPSMCDDYADLRREGMQCAGDIYHQCLRQEGGK